MNIGGLTDKWLQAVVWCSLLLATGLFTGSAIAAGNAEPLQADQAFVFSAEVKNSGEVITQWQIAKGYYLYRDRFRITLVPGTETTIEFPKGSIRQSIERGQYEVYSGKLTIPVKFQSSEKQLTLSVNYQGCAEDGFCYPPMTKTVTLNLANQSVATSSATPASDTRLYALLTDQRGVETILQSQHLMVMLLIFLAIGVLLAFTPCVLPMVPILTVIIAGAHASTRKAFYLSLVYVMGMSITYALAGMAAALLGSSIQVWLQQPFFIVMTSGIFVLLALGLFGIYEFRLSHHWQSRITNWSNRHQGGTYLGVFSMGALSTLIVSPCVTAPLVGVLVYIGQTGNILLGASTLFMMGIGMGIPLLLVGTSAGRWLPKSGSWMETIKKVFGVLMIAMAIWMMSRIITAETAAMLWGVLLFGAAIYVGVFVPRVINRRLLSRCLGIVLAAVGLYIMFSGPSALDLTRGAQMKDNRFITVTSLLEVNRELLRAKATHRPVMIDFYADWCESCVDMDKNVLSKPEIQGLLTNFVLLRADLSANSISDQAMLKEYHVIAPPTLLFFDANGQEVTSKRIVGELSVSEFLGRMNVFIASGCEKQARC